MDWTKSYEQLMLIDGHEPYGCSSPRCNHIARNMLGMVLHHGFGAHHMHHRNSRWVVSGTSGHRRKGSDQDRSAKHRTGVKS